MTEKRWHHSASAERGLWRWWLWHNSRDVLRVEVSWRTSLTGLWLGRSDEGKWHASLGLRWLYMSCGWAVPWKRDRGYLGGREISITFHDRAMWWHLWVNRDSWSSDRPRWRDGCLRPVDIVFGREVCTRTDIEQRNVLVPMPEKAYPASAKLIEFAWKRPRCPWTKRMLRVEIDVPGGIPHSGKGENSWDCGDDATFGITTGECRTIPEGVGVLVGSCLRSRVKYGGWSEWTWSKTEAPGEQP